MKKLLNKNGSTLLMVIIMVAALTILGTALISMTMMSVNMKYNDYRAKKSMYFAEAGIDEVYAIVGKYVDDALVYATGSTEKYMEDLIIYVTTPETLYDGELYYNIIYYDSDGKYLDGAFNQTALQDIADRQFKEYFKEYFNRTESNGDNIVEKNFETSINSMTSIGGHPPTVTYDTISDFAVGGEFNISGLTSTFTYENLARKTITTDIVIKEPTVQYPLKVVENKIAVARNPLWQNAIVSSNGDIQFKNGITEIKGDIYALGKSADNPLKALEYGGVVVNDGNVTVIGDVVSKNYVQTRGNFSTLNISNAHVYCNSLTIQETANGSKINIDNSNVYTIDDIELNGPNSEIYIKGSYYGYSSGETFNSSSCIIINSDIDTGSGGSKITITGTAPNALDYDEDIDEHGVYIAGTAYVDAEGVPTDEIYDIYSLSDIWPYQTGESFSLKGNYKAYKYKFDNHPIFAADQLDFASVKDTAMEFVVKEKSSTNKFLVDKKVDYFIEYSKVGDLVLGTPDSVNIHKDDYKYTLGAKVGIINNKDLAILGASENPFPMADLALNITKDYNYYLYRSGNRGEFPEISEPNLSADPAPELDIFKYYTKIPEDTVIDNVVTGVGYALDAGKSATEIIYVGGEDITIGPDSNYTYDTSDLGLGVRLQGVILTTGTVTIHSDTALDFVGTIIAEGDIVIEGSGTKNFHNYNSSNSDSEEKDKYRYLIDLIDTNNDLEKVFNVENTGGDVISYIQTTYVDVSEGSNSYRDRYNELIDFRNWQVD